MKQKHKFPILCLALAAALLSGLSALSAPAPARALPAEQSGEAENLRAEPLAETEGYILREVEGGVAIFSGGRLVGKTEITAPLLRRADRSALQAGIRVESREELLKLIEDFDS